MNNAGLTNRHPPCQKFAREAVPFLLQSATGFHGSWRNCQQVLAPSLLRAAHHEKNLNKLAYF